MLKKKNFVVILQARMGSTRLKGKILKRINNKSILEILILRLKRSKKVSNIIVATTKQKRDDKIVDFCLPEIPEMRRQDLKPDAYIRSGSIYALQRDHLMIL